MNEAAMNIPVEVNFYILVKVVVKMVPVFSTVKTPNVHILLEQ